MLCQFSFPVFFDDLPDFIHSFDHEHVGVPKIVFGTMSILKQKSIVLCIKGVYGVQQACKAIVEAAPLDEYVSVCIRFEFCSIDIEFFQGDEPFLLHAAHELAIQFIQNLPCELFPLKS